MAFHAYKAIERTPSRRKLKYFLLCVSLLVVMTVLSTTQFAPKLASSPRWLETNYYNGRYLNFTTPFATGGPAPTQHYHRQEKVDNSTNSNWEQKAFSHTSDGPPLHAHTLSGTVHKPGDNLTARSSSSTKSPVYSSSVQADHSNSVNVTAHASTMPQVTTLSTTKSDAGIIDSTSTSTTTVTTTVTTTTTSTTTAVTTSTTTSTLSQVAQTQNATRDDRQLLCHSFTGRLGNEMFQYASVWGLALTMNRIPVFMGSTALEGILNKSTKHPTRQAEFEQRCAKAKSSGEGNCCTYSQQLTTLEPASDYTVGMYLQSWKYWKDNEERVKRKLQFSDAIQASATHFVNDLRQQHNESTLIAVHIRQGDFATEHNSQLGYRTATPDYIRRAFYFFKQRYPKSVFVVSSDGIEWCKKNVPSKFTIHYLEANTPPVDLLVLSSLDHIVTSFGSFSWFAGYLNNGTTVYIRDFIVPDTYIGNQFKPNGEDYIYPGWIPL